VEDSADVFKSELFSKDPEVGFGDGGSVPIQEIPGVLRAFKVDNGAFAEWRVSVIILCSIFRIADALLYSHSSPFLIS
jgi:hypothetical protein